MKLQDVREKWGDRIHALGERYGAVNIRVFGSVARDEDTSSSDLDLLVTMTPGRTYLDLVGFWQDVEALLQCKVDVITDGGISPYLEEQITREAIPL